MYKVVLQFYGNQSGTLNVDPDGNECANFQNSGSTNPKDTYIYCKKDHTDLGIALDGDADRCVFSRR